MKENKINIQLDKDAMVSRKTDDLGRITIPFRFRKTLGIKSEDKPWLEIFLVDDGIYIRKKKFKYKGEE